jgi:hypothetical protein
VALKPLLFGEFVSPNLFQRPIITTPVLFMLIFFFILWGHFWQFHIRYTTKNQALRNSVSTALHTWLVRLVPVIKHSSPWFATLTNINNFKTHQPSTPTALLQSFAQKSWWWERRKFKTNILHLILHIIICIILNTER